LFCVLFLPQEVNSKIIIIINKTVELEFLCILPPKKKATSPPLLALSSVCFKKGILAHFQEETFQISECPDDKGGSEAPASCILEPAGCPPWDWGMGSQ
jgi:hypothetical protein